MPQARQAASTWIYLLLLLPFLGVLYPPLYSHVQPALYGVPFFVWYQVGWTVLAAIIIGVVHLATERPDDDVQPPRTGDEELTPP